MATVTKMLISPSAGQLRPFDIHRDLGVVADLVERCFASTLDPDGERYLRQMRSAAHNPAFLRWAAAATEWSSVPMSGYVWEEAGEVIGNISLIPFNLRGQRLYLIANVAVHPDFRRQGIARKLTVQAIEHARRRGAPSVWLHVREENDAAVALYDSLGFIEQARRTTWFAHPEASPSIPPEKLRIERRHPKHWEAQFGWLHAAYPPEVTWHLAVNPYLLRPGILGSIQRMVNGVFTRQWSALRDGRLVGVIAWQMARSYADPLWLAAAPDDEDQAAYSLLVFARQRLALRRALSLDYPAGRAREAIQAAGFTAHQTLIWMQKLL